MRLFFSRLRLAVAILSGKMKIEGSKLICNKNHLGSDEAPIKKDRLKALEGANDDLKVATGFIGDAGKWPEFQLVIKANK